MHKAAPRCSLHDPESLSWGVFSKHLPKYMGNFFFIYASRWLPGCHLSLRSVSLLCIWQVDKPCWTWCVLLNMQLTFKVLMWPWKSWFRCAIRLSNEASPWQQGKGLETEWDGGCDATQAWLKGVDSDQWLFFVKPSILYYIQLHT